MHLHAIRCVYVYMHLHVVTCICMLDKLSSSQDLVVGLVKLALALQISTVEALHQFQGYCHHFFLIHSVFALGKILKVGLSVLGFDIEVLIDQDMLFPQIH